MYIVTLTTKTVVVYLLLNPFIIINLLLITSVESFHFYSKTINNLSIIHRQQQQQQQQQKKKKNPRWFSQPPILFGVKSTSTQEDDKTKTTISQKKSIIQVGTLIGSGSYGTVHQLSLDGDENVLYVGKRPWKQKEIEEKFQQEEQQKEEKEKEEEQQQPNDSNSNNNNSNKDPKERASRCLYYWEVEEHCFTKLPSHPQIPPYYGTRDDWMIFGFLPSSSSSLNDQNLNKEEGEESQQQQPAAAAAPTLSDLMKLDRKDPQNLIHTSSALGCSSYSETLDRIMESLLTVLEHVHSYNIVHRDIKPSNLLVSNQTLVLMDFGSAADLEPEGIFQRRKGLENGNRVAISPIYCAPEIFIELNRNPLSFDIFSSALLFCQLLFSYLDERMDAGFHQQLEETKWDLNKWLENELATKLRPQGLEHALVYLQPRQGLWTLLQDMFAIDPMDRPKANQALRRFQQILRGEGPKDSPYLTMVYEAMEMCDIDDDVIFELPTTTTSSSSVMSRPLHFVATFSRGKPLGLVLAELDDTEMDPFWQEATKDAVDGEVFVKEIVPGGQADELGIFDIGDRLVGIGELPFFNGGFERAVEMLQAQPKKDKNVRLHFDRITVRSNEAIDLVPSPDVEIHIADRGAWSSIGRRKAQEDAFVLHEIHHSEDRSVLVTGVMDGHGGTAASTMVSSDFPSLLSQELFVSPLPDAMRNAWETVCVNYRQGCTSEVCSADYDPAEGILMANTGSEDLIAGTTTSIMALDETTAKLTVLNCGDSRSVVSTEDGKVKFVSADHKPQSEEGRIVEGIANGLDYSRPECSWSRWWIKVGDYEYAVGRSLEGPFATSKGIVSDPDLTTLSVIPGDMLISATDGLWDVMDSREVARDISKMRKQGMSASESAKALCSMALRKGTSDNISVVVTYL